MPSRHRWVPRLALGTALLASCDTDERNLSFEIGAVGSAGFGASAHGDAGGPGSDGGAHGDAGETSMAGGDHGSADGGEAAMGGQDSGTAGTGASVASGGSAPGTAGNNTGGAGSSGAGTGGASAGTGGSAGSGGTGVEPFISPCGDLNDNRVDDCEETLVQNSRFDAASTGWTAGGALLTQEWVSTDARDQTGSGSLSITNTNVIAGGTGNTTLGSGQCLPAWGNENYEVGARVFIKPGQGGGRAAVNLLIFGHDNCQGVLLSGVTPASVSTAGSWQVVHGKVELPPATRSILVRLVATKPFAQSSLEVLFDDVLVRESE